MGRFKIGVMSDSFRLSPRDGVRKSKEVGADGIQIYAVAGEICPEVMDRSTRADFRRYCAELGLEIAALCGDLGGHGFERADDNIAKVERSKRIVDLAVDLGTAVVTTHIGVVPANRAHPRYAIMQAACRELGDYARKAGVIFAIETGPETAAVLKTFLDDVGSPGVGVNLDPANFVMVTGQDPVEAVHILKDYIVHTHAKDGIRLKPSAPEQVYGAFAEGGVEGLTAADIAHLFQEVPLGQGDVPWDAYLNALSAIGYAGFLTIEREVGDNPEQDIRDAIQFLRAKA